MFGAAGTLSWPRGWIYTIVFAIGFAAMSLVVWRYNPVMFQVRGKLHHKDTKPFDKVFFAVYFPLALIQPALAGLDVMRFRWSSISIAAMYLGVALFAFSCATIGWVMVVNRFAENTVRIQTERGHTVIMNGPYRFVRHPMYVGLSLFFLSGALILGSWWALASAAAITVLVVWRTAMEDRTLRRELAGYEEFTTHTRYRLVPGVW